jgi:hypothetical protein
VTECCSSCLPIEDPVSCEAGRTEFYARLEEQKPQWLSCTEDSECFVLSSPSACGSICDLLVSGPAFSEPYGKLQNQGLELCLHCPSVEYTCDEHPFPAARCVDGSCELVP